MVTLRSLLFEVTSCQSCSSSPPRCVDLSLKTPKPVANGSVIHASKNVRPETSF